MTWLMRAIERRRIRREAAEDIQARLEEKVADLVECAARPYCPPDASVVRAGEASESAMVAQFVPAAEIH